MTFTWQYVYNDTDYNVNNTLIFPEATVQLNLDDDTAVRFPYRGAQYTEIVLYLHGHTTPTANHLNLNVRNHLIQLCKAPRNFLRAAITRTDLVNAVSAPPANGRVG